MEMVREKVEEGKRALHRLWSGRGEVEEGKEE